MNLVFLFIGAILGIVIFCAIVLFYNWLNGDL